MASSRGRCIQPLPEAVAAQIKSSTAIVSLTSVVLELLKNSLDAKATKIEATVDFTRGGCTVEDDGLGIAPSEFRQDGNLCKLHCTSKYYSEDVSLGRNGTFLAALAAMCLLQVVSRHHENRSHNLLSLHHSKVIDRQLPAQAQHEIHQKHGTRVTVRNLFGNLPVRVKQRAALIEQKPELDRLWRLLKREVTGLLLSWRQPVALRIRDADGNTLLNFSDSNRVGGAKTPHPSASQSLLNILTQANFITFDEWPAWVPTSASTSTISIKGAISLDPAPTKRVQFISLGIKPLSAESGHNELFDEVNRIFSLSSFGTIEDDANVDEHEKVKRQSDKRFKSDGYTNRQLTARKGVDRYPMFHLRISLKSNNDSVRSEDQFIEDETNLQTVVGVLNAMITQWLSAHHFRPRKPCISRARHDDPSGASSSDSGNSMREEGRAKNAPSVRSDSKDPAKSWPRKTKKLKSTATEKASNSTQLGPFAQWSRIKSGRSDFLENLNMAKKTQEKESSARPSTDHVRSDTKSDTTLSSRQDPAINISPLLAGSLNGSVLKSPAVTEPGVVDDEAAEDAVMTWTDPSTKQTFLLNARTGCVLPRPPPRSVSAPSVGPLGATLTEYNKPLRLTHRQSTSGDGSTPWLSNFLQTWENPAFKPAEKSIQQVCSHEHQFDGHEHGSGRRFGASHIELAKAFSTASGTSIGKLSKPGLANAEVMAQLDKKFILVKMRNSPENPSNSNTEAEVLVLIDQHAADERIQVETLLSDLCMPLPKDHIHSGYRSKLGHRSHVTFTILEKPIQFAVSDQEQQYFVTYAPKFAAWGILFSVEPLDSARQQSVMSVTTLPPAISERCKADPQVLITFLRSALWKYVDVAHSAAALQPGISDHDEHAAWVRRILSCPDGLIDLVNSRACRSAIMFNDELSLEACTALVRMLAKCVFPFMCAHGRPSMVPLVDMGSVGGESSVGFGTTDASREKDFVTAWKARKM
ncbi:hypothetical protein CC80DRAFT_447293 [Byssothecium circinans]|uniref:MutL C-terminal dimerisation domain-containing protein n=1 Tax=Byssothecium circinans TaxID=147558 RepID=A0A6A5TSA8_9PLEO|nr:hypothetical protein CC80DRAFT_447293 [Byssothecium circinans]